MRLAVSDWSGQPPCPPGVDSAERTEEQRTDGATVSHAFPGEVGKGRGAGSFLVTHTPATGQKNQNPEWRYWTMATVEHRHGNRSSYTGET